MAMAMAMSVPCAARGYGCGDSGAQQRLRISSSNSRFAVSALQCGTITRSSSSSSSILSKTSRNNSLEATLASFTLGGAPGLQGYGGIYVQPCGERFGTGNGSRWYCLKKLGMPSDRRKALLRALTTQLLRHGRIKTTRARAKAMRKPVDHMITLAKKGTLHDRRQALAYIYDKYLVRALFLEAPERYAERTCGYTRIIRTMPRKGDAAPMAYIELV